MGVPGTPKSSINKPTILRVPLWTPPGMTLSKNDIPQTPTGRSMLILISWGKQRLDMDDDTDVCFNGATWFTSLWTWGYHGVSRFF